MVGLMVSIDLKPPTNSIGGKLFFEYGFTLDLGRRSEYGDSRYFTKVKWPGPKLSVKKADRFYREALWQVVIPELKKLLVNNGFKNWVIKRVYLEPRLTKLTKGWEDWYRGRSFGRLNVKIEE